TGAIFKLDLEGGYHTYGRILGKSNYAFYNKRTKDEVKDMREIIDSPILFIVAVYNSAITKGRWEKVGKMPLEDHLKTLPFKFIQDQIEPDKFRLYNPNTGEMTPTTKDQCEGLEAAAVWEAEHVEERIRDYFAGRPNKWVLMLQI